MRERHLLAEEQGRGGIIYVEQPVLKDKGWSEGVASVCVGTRNKIL